MKNLGHVTHVIADLPYWGSPKKALGAQEEAAWVTIIGGGVEDASEN